jgi:uncharacterized protein YqgC (DUF456 family)|tara:strand:- start:240 stop:719 length:480 start_codon:yes stop_codon:yes gene_type:complete
VYTFILLLSLIFLFLGLLGVFLPIIPGPFFSFLAILLLQFFTSYSFNTDYLIILGLLAIIITFLDYWLQVYSVRYFGGGKSSTIGVILGIILGIFFIPPIGVIVGPFIGAYLGALLESDFDFLNSFKVAGGALIGFLCGTILKFCYSLFTIWSFISNFL